MPGEIGFCYTLIDLGADPRNEICICPLQLRCQQVQTQRQTGARFSCKQIDDRIFRVGQRVAWTAANMGVMGGQLPAAFLTYQPETIDDGIEKTALPFGAFPQNQRVQLQSSGKIKRLETIAIASTAIFPVIARQNDGPRLAKRLFRRLDEAATNRIRR